MEQADAGASGINAFRLPQPELSGGPSRPQKAKVPACPQCGSRRVFKDGLRKLTDGSTIQRHICRDCGYRFSEGTTQASKTLKASDDINIDCQVCVGSDPAKNLAGTVLVPMEEKAYNESRSSPLEVD